MILFESVVRKKNLSLSTNNNMRRVKKVFQSRHVRGNLFSRCIPFMKIRRRIMFPTVNTVRDFCRETLRRETFWASKQRHSARQFGTDRKRGRIISLRHVFLLDTQHFFLLPGAQYIYALSYASLHFFGVRCECAETRRFFAGQATSLPSTCRLAKLSAVCDLALTDTVCTTQEQLSAPLVVSGMSEERSSIHLNYSYT